MVDKVRELALVAYEGSEGRSVSDRLRVLPKGATSMENGVFGTGSAMLCCRSCEKLSDDFCGLKVFVNGGLLLVALALMERL